MEKIIQYKANDGNMFSSEEVCLHYERCIKTQRLIINQYRREMNQRGVVGECMRSMNATKKLVASIQSRITAHRDIIYTTLPNGQREVRDDWSKDNWLAYELRRIKDKHHLKTQEVILKTHKDALKRAEHDLNEATNKLSSMILKAYQDGDLDMWDKSVGGFGNDIVLKLMERFRIGPKCNK